MEVRKLSLEEMNLVIGGSNAKLEIGCGVTNMAIVASLYFGPAGWIGAIGMAASAYMSGCYDRKH